MDAVVDSCRRFHECEGCSHCSESPRRCEYCADPWDECLCDFRALPTDDDEDGGELFTACAECGAFGIPVDDEGMAAELCDECETPPAVRVVRDLSALATVILENRDTFTDAMRDEYIRTIGEAVSLIRTHAVPTSHPWAVK